MPGLIPDAEMAAMRATAESASDTAITWQRNTAAQDLYGLMGETWSTIGTGYARFAAPPSKILTQYAEQIGTLLTQLMTWSQSYDIRQEDRIISGSDTLRVHMLIQPESYSTMNQALVTEVR